MNPFDYAQSFSAYWRDGVEAMLKAQAGAGKALVDGMRAMTAGGLPGTPAGIGPLGMPPFDLGVSGADMSQAAESVMSLLTSAGTLSASIATAMASRTGNETVEATFRHMADPRRFLSGGGELDDVLGRMADGPRFADLWDMERRTAQVMQAWVEVRRRGFEHSAVVLQAWTRAATQFTEATSGPRPEATSGQVQGGSPVQGSGQAGLDAKQALAQWVDIANRELLETQRSEAFLASQSAMIRASTALRLAQQSLVEHVGKQYGFPTRTELDDVHRTVTGLRREMRALRRQARQTEAAPPPLPLPLPSPSLPEPLPVPPPAAPTTAAKARLAPRPKPARRS